MLEVLQFIKKFHLWILHQINTYISMLPCSRNEHSLQRLLQKMESRLCTENVKRLRIMSELSASMSKIFFLSILPNVQLTNRDV